MNRLLAVKLVVLVLVAMLLVLSAGVAGAREQQLAGMRLSQHAVNLLDVYGQPDGIVVGWGPEFASAAQLAPGAPLMGGPSPQMLPPTAGMGSSNGHSTRIALLRNASPIPQCGNSSTSGFELSLCMPATTRGKELSTRSIPRFVKNTPTCCYSGGSRAHLAATLSKLPATMLRDGRQHTALLYCLS